ncbi:MAG TPA: DUF4389 domain-containing protein [Nocardioides sp.]|uniref:DUF4389 domain-containing protein n=1 Tax=Nocardioides sp. TaxID=35761 RepID=UPI002D1BFE5B|nr:DUF4389 domain-containing protein [Nocardioides sp.]HTW13884.1 DUF4389 domain-containing protein [Nocardioides sp.]
MSAHSYPVRVDATLDESRLSRWLWLVKWVLVIPHAFVLVALWLVFAILSVVALVAIVATGRYPRSIFDFNVGVLRWTWRVAFYAAGGFATDRYPPFSLHDRSDYPAHLDIVYPEALSRGLALVKWWLLAIPHYLVLGFLVGGGAIVVGSTADDWAGWSGGLVSLLAVIAAVVLLVTGRYPQPVFDLVLGLDRWVLRVAAYAALMTDEYPPFRLDQGGEDPGTIALRSVAASGAPATHQPGPVPDDTTAPPTHPGRERRNPGRIAVLVAAMLVGILGLLALVAGAGLAVVDRAARDGDDYLMTGSVTVRSAGYAVQTEHLGIDGEGLATDLPHRFLGTVRVTSIDLGGNPTFVGVGDSDDVDDYLGSVARSTITEPGDDGEGPQYEESAGGAPATPPGQQSFWAAKIEGDGRQTLDWKPGEGDWTLVVMTADGSSPVVAQVAVGATVPGLDETATALALGGLVLLGIGGLTASVALARPRGPREEIVP